ncbi:extracellular catalytic domain type 1 short-chain-length polyhydroxyalkanoate depolymerase [Actinomadura latina]|uniref:PHB depolymerase family esterase n=1 Tax=Actinomadura latina TaxID=163603 RepID=A0A846Z5B5_9ACTN|nr:PHB depolymerase family esterase [Actinomadura latina]NKZ07431.1 PHB depolymerase family esterase [Actinomadura latina]
MRRITRLLAGIAAVIVAAALCVATAPAPRASAAALTQVSSFGANPGNLQMYVYIPDSVQAHPGILVAMHGCNGWAPGFFQGTEFASLADQYGFIVVYPQASHSANGMSNCFDVWSDAALHHGGGSDPVSIVSMVTYVEQHYGGDPQRVFATGFSSGAMETNNLLAVNPDVFTAGAPFSGVPYGCFGPSGCGGKTPQQWGDLARAAYPGYDGPRPRVQAWHGTNDTVLNYSNLQEETDQWTNVMGLSQTPTSTDTPRSGWTRQRFADSSGTPRLEAFTIAGAGHDLPHPGMAAYAIHFFGLDGDDGTPPPPPPASCRVAPTVSAWPGGMTENITITNTGDTTIDGWSLAFTLPSGQTITSGWNASYSPSSGQVTAASVSYNGSLAPGASTGIGFQATQTGNAAAPTAFTLNGSTCTVSTSR